MKQNQVARSAALFAVGSLLAGSPAVRSLCPSAGAAEQKMETLNNAAIIEMQGLNLGEGVIVDKIRTSGCDFDVSLAALKQLKEARVSDPVIQAMIAAKSPLVPPPGDINDPNACHDSGMWLYEETGPAGKMTPLSREAYDLSQANVPINAFHLRHSAIVLPAAAAKTQSSSRRPVFYLYLRAGRAENPEGLFALTPDQFTLCHLKVIDQKKQPARTISVGSGSSLGGTSGIPLNEQRRVDWSKTGPGIYKVIPQADLEDGEYAFCYSSSQLSSGHDAGRVLFCFGVHVK